MQEVFHRKSGGDWPFVWKTLFESMLSGEFVRIVRNQRTRW